MRVGHVVVLARQQPLRHARPPSPRRRSGASSARTPGRCSCRRRSTRCSGTCSSSITEALSSVGTVSMPGRSGRVARRADVQEDARRVQPAPGHLERRLGDEACVADDDLGVVQAAHPLLDAFARLEHEFVLARVHARHVDAQRADVETEVRAALRLRGSRARWRPASSSARSRRSRRCRRSGGARSPRCAALPWRSVRRCPGRPGRRRRRSRRISPVSSCCPPAVRDDHPATMMRRSARPSAPAPEVRGAARRSRPRPRPPGRTRAGRLLPAREDVAAGQVQRRVLGVVAGQLQQPRLAHAVDQAGRCAPSTACPRTSRTARRS